MSESDTPEVEEQEVENGGISSVIPTLADLTYAEKNTAAARSKVESGE